MSKIVKIQVLGADGNPLVNHFVSLSEHGERETNSDGMVQYLADDDTNVVLQLGKEEVWSGSTNDLKKLEVFTQSGAGYNRA